MAATDLPAYSGPEGDCPKCGVPGVLTVFHWTGGQCLPGDLTRWEAPCDDVPSLTGEHEHLCRICRNCGYGRVEAVAEPEGERALRAPPRALTVAPSASRGGT